ncbi:lantibiotic dehydratase [Marinitenerispora sediminis]|uniref:Lantibiotic dehydratase n=1 Tax=Marinitenerispora sediminis TaxID=1931232 RepID=A0A368TAD8_9ACTN|nr:lantibiotic dehydratase [Marinitenerispora sediminis]RCV53981.1 lantibiotic dehydratase [Marinitenerispora sediminis]RCV60488.1 lantibiotic dehydratase [Marinitenerispora sediminis]RCV61851.1 lantibiotic dehydratase [Marinitenerispora sediminis]
MEQPNPHERRGSDNGGPARWRLYPRLLLRRAGFGVETMTSLGDDAVAAAAARYREHVRALEAARTALLRDTAPRLVETAAAAGDRAALRGWSAVRRSAGRRRPIPGTVPDPVAAVPDVRRYAAALAAEQAAGRSLREAAAAEAERRAGRLGAVLADPRVRDALVQLAPSFYQEVRRRRTSGTGRRPSAKDRAFLRRGYLYCQRLGAKNETTSFFGPLVHGRVDTAATGVRLGPEAPGGVRRFAAHVSFWAVRELARAMAADPAVAPRVPVGWVAAARLAGERLTLPGGREVRLSPAQARLAAAVDGTRTRAELAGAAGLAPEDADRFVDRLARAGAVRTWPEPASTAPSPFDVLLADAAGMAAGTPWPARLRELREHVAEYAGAADADARLRAQEAAEAVFTELTSTAARRAGGRMYADRGVLSLDAEGDQSPFTVGGDVAARWERELSPVLDAAGRYGILHRDAYRGLCADILAETGPLAYPDLVTRMERAVAEGRAEVHLKPARAFAAEYAELVRRHTAGDTAAVPPEELRRLAGRLEEPLFASPDLMLERRPDGGTRLVLGELHPYVYAWGSQGMFAERDPGLLADFRADLSPWGGAERMATVVRLRRHKGLLAEWFPGRFVEVTALASRDRSRTLAVGDLTAVLDAGVPRLRAPDGDVVLYSGDEDHPHLVAFSAPAPMLPPARCGDRAPRVLVGDVLVQRARYWAAATDLAPPPGAGPGDALTAVQRLRAVRGLPRFAFAHVPGEPKPVGVDLDAPAAVDALVRLAAAQDAREVSLVEMRPAPGDLWLRHHGRPTTSEFRIALRRAADPDVRGRGGAGDDR